MKPAAASANSNSRTIADTIVGEHEHTICGYSLLKGIGDGEPVASDRFSVGGHDWVLLFYPDGKKSSNSDHGQVYPRAAPNLQLLGGRNADGNGQNGAQAAERDARADAQPVAAAELPQGGNGAAERQEHLPDAANNGAIVPVAAPGGGAGGEARVHAQQGPQGGGPRGGAAGHADPAVAVVQAAANAAQAAGMFAPVPPLNFHVHVPPPQPPFGAPAAGQRGGRRAEGGNEYCALFVALIGEGAEPQGVINTSEGKVVRAFHRFTLVDQQKGRDITKGRQRADGAVKISCARQDPNARNCHGYRKFVRKAVLEDPSRGFLLNDRLVIRYTIELVVSQGGALMSKGAPAQSKIEVPGPTIGSDFSTLLQDEASADVTIRLLPDEDAAPEGASGDARAAWLAENTSEVKAHRLVLCARSSVFRRMLGAGMQEGSTGVITIHDLPPRVFEALLYFIYTDALPDELQGGSMSIAMAQPLLMASDRYQLERLRAICEKRLVDTVEVETVSTTLMLADKCNAYNLRQVCLAYVASNLSQVITTQEYQRLTESCQGMVNEILAAVARQGSAAVARSAAPRPAMAPPVRRVTRRRVEDEPAAM